MFGFLVLAENKFKNKLINFNNVCVCVCVFRIVYGYAMGMLLF